MNDADRNAFSFIVNVYRDVSSTEIYNPVTFIPDYCLLIPDYYSLQLFCFIDEHYRDIIFNVIEKLATVTD